MNRKQFLASLITLPAALKAAAVAGPIVATKPWWDSIGGKSMKDHA